MARDSPPDAELAIPSMDSMMKDDDKMRVFALAAYGSAHELQELLDATTDSAAMVNLTCPESGTTPLIVAMRRDNSGIALALIKGGADLTQANKAGWTPMSAATKFASPKVVEMLEQRLSRSASREALP